MTDICEKYVRDEYSADGKLERVWFDLPDNFNFGYDVVDHIAKNETQKRAIVFKSLKGDVTEYSFEDGIQETVAWAQKNFRKANDAKSN